MRDLDTADREEACVHQPTSAELQEKLTRLQERRKRYRGCVRELTASGETQRSWTDPESQSMPKSPQVDVGDNVPIAVDSKHQRIVAQDVTKAITDDEQLSSMAMRAKETRGGKRIRAVADMGYDHGHEITACEETDIEADVPKPSTSAHTKRGLFGKERFTDAPEKDCYRCPRGVELTFRFGTAALGRQMRYDATGAGRRWSMTAQCTNNNDGRRMSR